MIEPVARVTRWTEGALLEEFHAPDGRPTWRLACMIVLAATRKSARVIVIRKLAPEMLDVSLEIDGILVHEVQPPAKLLWSLVKDMTVFCGPLYVEVGTSAKFELIRGDGTLLDARISVGSNEHGPTLTLTLATLRRTRPNS